MKTKIAFALFSFIAMNSAAVADVAAVTPEQAAYCASQGGYVASDDACWVGTPATCGPSSPSFSCIDPIPQLGVIIKMCGCQQ